MQLKYGQLVWCIPYSCPARVEKIRGNHGVKHAQLVEVTLDKKTFTQKTTVCPFELEPLEDRETTLKGFQE